MVKAKRRRMNRDKSFTDYAKEKIKEVHGLSVQYNGKDFRHTEKLLELVEKHSIEIKELYADKDDHLSTEVGDLMILCMEILLEQQQDLDGILNKCYDRYETKLMRLISDRKKQ